LLYAGVPAPGAQARAKLKRAMIRGLQTADPIGRVSAPFFPRIPRHARKKKILRNRRNWGKKKNSLRGPAHLDGLDELDPAKLTLPEQGREERRRSLIRCATKYILRAAIPRAFGSRSVWPI
jgi:hypothetical protein